MSDSTRFSAVLGQLDARFGGRPAVTPGEALAALPGMAQADPESAAQQRIGRGTYPFPFRLVAGRNVVLVVDIAVVLAGVDPDQQATSQPARRRGPGRPRKIAGGAP